MGHGLALLGKGYESALLGGGLTPAWPFMGKEAQPGSNWACKAWGLVLLQWGVREV